MNYFIKLAFLFFVGCIVGWVGEFFFRRFAPVKSVSHKWENPGFLMGPYLPVYGFGQVICYLVCDFYSKYTPHGWLGVIVTFFIMAIVLTFIELIAGLIFINMLKVQLWDYEDEWLNFKGIICPLYSAMWGIFGVGYYYLVHPYAMDAVDWLSRNLAFSFVVGFFYGIFTLDVVFSFNLVVKVKAFADEHDIVVRYNDFLDSINGYKVKIKESPKFLLRRFALFSDRDFRGSFEEYRDRVMNGRIGRSLERGREILANNANAVVHKIMRNDDRDDADMAMASMTELAEDSDEAILTETTPDNDSKSVRAD